MINIDCFVIFIFNCFLLAYQESFFKKQENTNVFINCNLFNSVFIGAKLDYINFKETNVSGMNFANLIWMKVIL